MTGYTSRTADKFVARMPEGMRDEIAADASQQHISMNTWFIQAAEEKLERAERQELLLDALKAAAAKAGEK